MEKKRVLITVGGTGGHIYPAIALAKQLSKECEVLFVGGNLKTNPFFSRHGFPYQTICCAPLSGKNPLRLIMGMTKIVIGYGQSVRLIQKFKPNVVVGFGSYYTFPTLLAAKTLRVPIVLHEANSIPGKVNRIMSPFAVATGIHFPETANLLKGKTAVVGMPIRQEFSFSDQKRELAYSYYNLDPKKKTILVFGGSQGAKAINTLFLEAAERLDLQILHMTGDETLTKKCLNHYRSLGLRCTVKDFEARMDLAWSVADLFISRSGASTIAEQLKFKVPGIFIPYPFATDRHQDKNADFVVKSVGGAVKLDEKGLTSVKLAEMIESIDLDKMKRALEKFQPAELDLATLVRQKL